MTPLAMLTGVIVRRRRRAYQSNPRTVWHPGIPVIVVGNLFVGGTGKTPVVIALAQGLRARGMAPGILSRGYGTDIGPTPRLGQGQLDALLFGDEPALIARQTGAPLAVHPRRVEAAQALRRAYPEVDVIISDDGLQHLALVRDIEIIVQDTRGIGNGRMLPAGPLREPASRLAEVDVVITNAGAPAAAPVGLDGATALGPAAISSATRVQTDQITFDTARPLAVTLHLTLGDAVQLTTGLQLSLTEVAARSRDTHVWAAAGIGHPTRYFDMLRAAGIHLTNTRTLPDHHDWRGEVFEADIDMVLVTAKDAVKCAALNDPRLWEIPLKPQFNPIDFIDLLAERIRFWPNLH